MEDALGEALRGVALVEITIRHGEIALRLERRLCGVDGDIIGQLDEYVDDGLGPDAVNRGAADVMNRVRVKREQDGLKLRCLLPVPIGPAIPVLRQHDGKELPQLLEGHISQGLAHERSPPSRTC